MSFSNKREYGILSINNNTIFNKLQVKDSLESNWTTCLSKPEYTALIGYALVKVSDCKIKNPHIQKISIINISYTNTYWTTGRHPPLDVYDSLDDDDNIICLVYGIKRKNGKFDIDINPLIGGKANKGEQHSECFFRETFEETGINFYQIEYSKSIITPYYDRNITYFILKI